MSRGQDWGARSVRGGKSCGVGDPDGAGTPITPSRLAIPLRGSYRRTWITSPSLPGVSAGLSWSSCEVSGMPET